LHIAPHRAYLTYVRIAIAAILGLAGAGFCAAQQWEIGGSLGYGFYREARVFSPEGNATAGIRSRFAAGGWLGEDMYEYIGGEVRYTYQDGDPFLSADGVKVNIQGQSHAIHYDLLIHTQPQERKVRPYVAAGLGAKIYVISGPANPASPLGHIATLTTQDETKLLFSLGGGVKIRLYPHVVLRFDVRDYLTTFPKKIIAPAPGGTARGIFQQFTPLVGISYSF
jgi:opacity protein-like surface antigen